MRRLAWLIGLLALFSVPFFPGSSAKQPTFEGLFDSMPNPDKKILSGSDMNLRIDEGAATHFLVREGRTAAHVNLLSGRKPRLLVAFPAGNSGTGMWFSSPLGEVEFTVTQVPSGLTPTKLEGAKFESRGVRFEARANRDRLIITSALLGSVRHIRDWDVEKQRPKEIIEKSAIAGQNAITFWRKSLDGQSYYEMGLTVVNGTIKAVKNGFELKSETPGQMRLQVHASSADPALTPITFDKLLKPEYVARTDQRSLQLLAFLVYQEKFLAGSWTYLTYFGRDTLLTMRLLMDALQPEAIEAMLGAIVNRINKEGDVAHEEEIGDFATAHNIKLGNGAVSTPVYDYEMIDDDFLLPPILWQYLKRVDATRAMSFLARKTDQQRSFHEAIAANLQNVLDKSKAFAEKPSWQNLIGLKTGRLNGQWRDSHEGLGLGHFPYDVNVAMVPAALSAAAGMYARTDLALADGKKARLAAQYASVWTKEAPVFFHVELEGAVADRQAQEYSEKLKLFKAANAGQGLRFSAIALDETGRPIPVMHSDEGFRLLFTDPEPSTLSDIAGILVRPFPYGLRSRIGMLIANPAFASAEKQSLFTTAHYHGTVVWSWQQALMAAGLARQLKRRDLPVHTRKSLRYAQSVIWGEIRATERYRTAELWSWRVENGVMVYVPYGQGENDHTEANPDQGWSHAFLGLTPPNGTDPAHGTPPVTQF